MASRHYKQLSTHPNNMPMRQDKITNPVPSGTVSELVGFNVAFLDEANELLVARHEHEIPALFQHYLGEAEADARLLRLSRQLIEAEVVWVKVERDALVKVVKDPEVRAARPGLTEDTAMQAI